MAGDFSPCRGEEGKGPLGDAQQRRGIHETSVLAVCLHGTVFLEFQDDPTSIGKVEIKCSNDCGYAVVNAAR